MKRAVAGVAFLVPLLTASGLRYLTASSDGATQRLLNLPAFESPGPLTMSAMSLNHRTLLGDLLWLRTIQFIGTGDESQLRDRGPIIMSMADLTTDADPRYYTVYWSSATVLTAYVESAERSNRIIDKALHELGPRWELFALKAYNAFFLQRDAKAASALYARAAQIEGAPQFLSSLAGRAKTLADGPDAAIAMLEELLPTLPEGPHRQDALDRIELAQREKMLMAYDRACDAFLEANGRLPEGPEALNDAGFIRAPTEDSFGKPVYFERYRRPGPREERCVARTDEVERRDFEVEADIAATFPAPSGPEGAAP